VTKAAGILFHSMNGNGLFLRRTATAHDCPSCWDLPGGGQEGDESPEQTAKREAREEIGFLPEGERLFHTRTASPPDGRGVGTAAAGVLTFPVLPAPPQTAMPPDVDFTTFLQKVTNEFTPELDSEHDGWAWAPIESPPQPLHPGVKIALDRLTMDELGVARAIADGRLTSPQKYENMWLFAIRITGTDTAFRPKNKEFVYRNPDHYLNEDFLARCNGLPVIFKHPVDAPLLNKHEFANRVVGTVFLPYISGSEVWAIVKIFIDEVAELMEAGGLSTSPGVNFQDFSVNARLKLEDGAEVLIEGKPSLLDHVAICKLGVWDKGGAPAGIRSEAREDSAMTPEEQAAADKAKKDADEKAEAEAKAKKDAEDKAKQDADAGSKLDKILSHLDSVNSKVDAFGKRMDAFEEDKSKKDADEKAKADAAKKDADEKSAKEKEEAEKVAADKAKKDAEEEEKKKREDAAKADSADVRKRIDEVAAMIPKSIGDADYHAVVDSQSRADEVYSAFGAHAPRPLAGESAAIYERRVVRDLAKHSPKWGKVDVSTAFADDAAFDVVRDEVYGDAKRAALAPSTAPDGQLRQITKRTDSMHTIHEFVGDPRAWMYPMAGPVRSYVTGRFDDSSVRGAR